MKGKLKDFGSQNMLLAVVVVISLAIMGMSAFSIATSYSRYKISSKQRDELKQIAENQSSQLNESKKTIKKFMCLSLVIADNDPGVERGALARKICNIQDSELPQELR